MEEATAGRHGRFEVRILLVEDEAAKAARIEALIKNELAGDRFELVIAETINDALLQLGEGRYGLVIVDLVLPQVKGAEPTDATQQWCEQIENHLSGRTASWIVMTGFAAVADDARRRFARHNVAVVSFDTSGDWERNLRGKLRDSYEKRPLDFIILCALEKERSGYGYADCALGDLEIVAGFDCQHLAIGELNGVIVVQPNPGLISAAITTTKALTAFKPRAVAMSGICGGLKGESELGAVVVPDISWNYQRGKFKNGALIADPFQVQVAPSVRRILSQMTSEEQSAELRKGLMFSDLSKAPIMLASMVSGSQVVVDESVGASIGSQSRKIAAVDMEVASVYFAAHEFFDGSGIYFAAKTVVDLADPHKDDRYHEYGAAISARFVVNALRRLLAPKSD